MQIKSASYLKSGMKEADYPRDRRPEFAFVGRSNVGKSSLMNTLLNKKGLAKTSARPGKTQTINFFDVNGAFYFVDLPGYGFAKVPLAIKEHWGRVMMSYLGNRETLRMVALLVDARHAPTDKDEDMLTLLEEAEVPTVIIATKMDKLKQGERKKTIRRIRETLRLDEEAVILPFSSVKGEGKRELWQVIEELL